MQDEVIVKHYLRTFFHIAVSVGNSPTVRDVAALPVQPLGVIVARMQTHSDAHNATTARCFPFCMVQQSARDTPSPKLWEHVQILNLGNLQVNKSQISRQPVHCDITGELATDSSN